MGQPITVVEKPSSNPAVLRFETNRPLSGMGHERYTAPPGEQLDRPVDELARRLFAAGGIEAVHINGSVVTVTLGRGQTGAGLGDVVRSLFLHYGSQADAAVAPPTDEGDRAPEATADPGTTPAALEAEEPAAAAPAAPEAAGTVDAATTEPGTAPSSATEPEVAAAAADADTSLAPPLDAAPAADET
jgi:hypothetical protein